jgi:integrase
MTTINPHTHARSGSAPKHEKPLTTDKDVGELARPKKGRRDYHVRDVPGLMVRVSPDSVRFIVRKRGPRPNDDTPGRIWKIVLGQFPTMTMHDAREEARVIAGRIERGEDPTRPAAAGMTLNGAKEWMLKNRALRPSTKRDYKDRWKRHLDAHTNVPMNQITAGWVKERMDEAQSKATKGDGVADANRLRSLLGSIFTEWCKLNPGANHPVRAVSKARNANGAAPAPRTQKLTVDQARNYALALERYAQGEGRPGKIEDSDYQKAQRRGMADYLTLNLYVGLRKSNGIGLRWEWIDLVGATITVPASETKTKKELVVNVPAAVLSMLKRRHDDPERHAVYVFPGRRNADKPMNSPGKAHDAVLKLAGLPDDAVTIHDMRRTLGSAMIASGADVSEVREQLGHANIATTSIYLNLKGENTVKKSLDRAAAAFGGEKAA